MHWLIVEDALRDRKGHWFEYVSTFVRGLNDLGDEVTVLVDHAAQAFVLEHLRAEPVLPSSIWHRMNDSCSRVRRYARVLRHAIATYHRIRRRMSSRPPVDIVFVPTILVHHLLGWFFLIKRKPAHSVVVLFFPNLPIRLRQRNRPEWISSPTAWLLSTLLKGLASEIKGGRVILGTETEEMQAAFAALLALPVQYFPHPVEGLPEVKEPRGISEITMACYGPARYEKGSDIMIDAIQAYLARYPGTHIKFIFQWLNDFQTPTGKWVSIPEALRAHPKVHVIMRYFDDGEYRRHLSHTHAMLLPYRVSSYNLRVSRLAIEALVNGLPVVAASGTTLASQISRFGAGIFHGDGDVASLADAIRALEVRYADLSATALSRRSSAQRHFSVCHFRECIPTAA
jgi:glycosyltransferase involved in cell wall biosynthesis